MSLTFPLHSARPRSKTDILLDNLTPEEAITISRSVNTYGQKVENGLRFRRGLQTEASGQLKAVMRQLIRQSMPAGNKTLLTIEAAKQEQATQDTQSLMAYVGGLSGGALDRAIEDQSDSRNCPESVQVSTSVAKFAGACLARAVVCESDPSTKQQYNQALDALNARDITVPLP